MATSRARSATWRTHSMRQLGLVDINAGQVIGAGEDGKPLRALYGRTASTVFLQPVGNGHYNSLQAQLQRRFADGLSLSVNYTWSRAMSPNENSSGTPNVQARGVHEPQLRAHRAAIARTTSASPTSGSFRSAGQALAEREAACCRYILGGWQINNMVSIMSGVAVQRLRRRHVAEPAGQQPDGRPGEARRGEARRKGSADTPYYDPSAFAEVTEARFGNTGYISLRGPGLFNWDFGLTREFSITSRRQAAVPHGGVQLHQHAHLGIPDNDVGDGEDFMTITGVKDLAREGIDERQFRLGFRVVF